MNKEDKLKALDAALTQIEKAYGKGSVMKLGDSGANMNIETVPTGSLSLDIALGHDYRCNADCADCIFYLYTCFRKIKKCN